MTFWKENKRKKLKILTGMVAVSMTIAQPAVLLAADGADSSDSSVADSEEEPIYAMDEAGDYVEVSDSVRSMIDSGTVYQDEDGYLVSAESGSYVDPSDGHEFILVDEDEEDTGDEDSDDSGEETGDETDEETGDEMEEETDGEDVEDGTSEEDEDSEKDKEEEEDEEEDDEEGSNKELIGKYDIKDLPDVTEDFRFFTVARTYAFAKEDLYIYEETDTGSEKVGNLVSRGLMYVLKIVNDDWLYVESGDVRGFVKRDQIYSGKDASKILKTYQERAREKAEEAGESYSGIETVAFTANKLVEDAANSAYAYFRGTTEQVVVAKEYALAKSDLTIREGKSGGSSAVGTLSSGGLMYILADQGQSWVYVESGDVRGFVKASEIKTGSAVTQKVRSNGQGTFAQAEQKMDPENNGALYYTKTSVKSGAQDNEARKEIIAYASQFLGNPYVWGGTSLTNGADCSGFVQSIYSHFGYSLPRVAENQAQYGTKIKVEDAQPGDLIFYARNGYIYHVVMYAGEGKTIEAMGDDYGITIGNVDTTHAVWATKILSDEETLGDEVSISAANVASSYGESLGDYTITYYCDCALCDGGNTGTKVNGDPMVEGQTAQISSDMIKSGTKIIIDGHEYTVQDSDGDTKGKEIRIYVNTHAEVEAHQSGKKAEVFLAK